MLKICPEEKSLSFFFHLSLHASIKNLFSSVIKLPSSVYKSSRVWVGMWVYAYVLVINACDEELKIYVDLQKEILDCHVKVFSGYY